MNLRFLLIASLSALSACQSVQTTQPGAVGVDRKQSMMVSSEDVNASAAKAYQQLIAGATQKGQVNRDAAQVARVRAVAQRLIRVTGTFRPDAPGWKWETNVISSKDVNAWVMPGGKIAVYTGLLERLQPTDDELAAVMGHEIAHALREHGRERVSQAQGQGLVIGVLGAIAGVSRTGMDLTALMVDLTLNKPNSREHEVEADRVGVELAARAGYDPRGAVSLWEKMAKLGGGQPPEFLSTHPSPSNRIADLKAYSAKVMPLYQASSAKR
ncbi:MAG TPA: M48 family metallopeptidase [Burkholderiales bacterium]|nr:M48 family metallopeptidase [Burkholderiales bacterium]